MLDHAIRYSDISLIYFAIDRYYVLFYGST